MMNQPADTVQGDQERDAALTKVTKLDSEQLVLREVVNECDRLLKGVKAVK